MHGAINAKRQAERLLGRQSYSLSYDFIFGSLALTSEICVLLRWRNHATPSINGIKSILRAVAVELSRVD